MVGVISVPHPTPTPRQRLRRQNTSVGIRLIEFIEPSDILIHLMHLIHVFLVFIFMWNKIFFKIVLYICSTWLGWDSGVAVLKVMCFWCSFWKVIGNQGFFRYSRYNLLRIAINAVL